MHVLLNTPRVQTKCQLINLQRDVYCSPMTQENMKHKKKHKDVDWCNNIVFMDRSREEIIEYMSKDNDDMRVLFPNIYIEGVEWLKKSLLHKFTSEEEQEGEIEHFRRSRLDEIAERDIVEPEAATTVYDSPENRSPSPGLTPNDDEM